MLLTSPPLTASNLKESIKFVRLACLMCAASVYPEPGSNSLILVSIFLLFRVNINQVCFSSFNFFVIVGSILLPLVVSHIESIIYFSMYFFCSCWNVLYYITFRFFCQYFF